VHTQQALPSKGQEIQRV